MITYKQLSLADILLIAKISLITINMSFLNFSIIPFTLMKLSRCLLFPIFMPSLADPENTFFIRCSRLCYYSLFSQSQQHPF